MLTAALLGSACAGQDPRAPADAPNVLLYVVDTLRADAVGAYGSPRATTPHIDALAADGWLFENAFANASWTRPSFASILTGLQPTRHGVERRSDALGDGIPTLASLLSERGYATALVSANPNVSSFYGFGRGFDEVVELYARRDAGNVDAHELEAPSDEVTRRAVRWLRGARRPFFLTVLAIDPHAPYTPPSAHDPADGRVSEVAGTFDWLDRPDLSHAERARIRELYAGEVAFNDASFGALQAALGDLGLADDTLVVLTSDHGEEFWESPGRRGHGRSLAEAALQVPLILRPATSMKLGPGRREPREVQLVDVAPTLLELLGVPPPPGLDGRSLLHPPRVERTIFASLALDGVELATARRFPWKLVTNRRSRRHALYHLIDRRRVPPHRAPAAWASLRRDLHAYVVRESPNVRVPEESPLPSALRDALVALGYVVDPPEQVAREVAQAGAEEPTGR